jgi:hypothetical protein
VFVLLSEYVLRLEQLLIYVELHGRHVHIHDHLDFVGEFSREVGLGPSQEEGTEDLVKRLDRVQILLVLLWIDCHLCVTILIFLRLFIFFIIEVKPEVEVLI